MDDTEQMALDGEPARVPDACPHCGEAIATESELEQSSVVDCDRHQAYHRHRRTHVAFDQEPLDKIEGVDEGEDPYLTSYYARTCDADTESDERRQS